MAKEKCSLTNDLVDLTSEKPKGDLPQAVPAIQSVDLQDTVGITIRVSKNLRQEIKTWCAKNNMSVVDTLKLGFQLVKQSKK